MQAVLHTAQRYSDRRGFAMKFKYVKTSNHEKFKTALSAVGKGAAREALGILLTGEPGTGKSRCMDHIGSECNAIYIEGLPGMTITYVRDFLAYELSVQGGSKFVQQKAIQDVFNDRRPLVIFDEAQHGLPKKAECIEYLRRIVEKAGCILVLVCHNSEKHRFGEHHLAHIATRISAVVEFKSANLADCQLYLNDLCEVGVDEGVAKQVLEQSRGRYRLMANACSTLEVLAAKLRKSALVQEDVKGFLLCEDAMKSLNRRGKINANA